MTEFKKAEKYYQLIREQVRSEDELYNRRITWLISMQAFLFASLGLIMRADVGTGGASEILRTGIFLLVALTGILVAIVSHTVLTLGRDAMHELKERWNTYSAQLSPRTRDFFPHPRGKDARDEKETEKDRDKKDRQKDQRRKDTIISRGFSSGNLPTIFIAIWLGFIALLAYDRLAAPATAGAERPEQPAVPGEPPAQAFAPD